MAFIKKKTGFILIIFLISSAILGPTYLNFININPSKKDFDPIELSINNVRETLNIINIPEKISKDGEAIRDGGIFDEFLVEELSNNYHTPKTKIIILFEEQVSKSEREDIIYSVLPNCEIIYNYDIVPGVYLSCASKDLIEQKDLIDSFGGISKIFKSKAYTFPYINEVLPSSSALNNNFFPNWWVSAVGADNLPYDGTGVKVAVIDTGIYNHPDLSISANRNFVSDELASEYEDDIGHGTHCAGIIGSDGGGSGGQYRGIAPGVELVNARAGDVAGLEEGDIIAAIQWSVNIQMVDILSMSFGDIRPVAVDPLGLALSAAVDSGVICVSSAGNSGPGYITGGSPASAIDVIAVGATNKDNELASFSSWGPSYTYLNYPDIVAPGVNIVSTESPGSIISDEVRLVGDYFDFAADGDYIPLSGTSMACPIVVGALAILKQAYPSLTPETARIALLEGASKLTSAKDALNLRSGFGLINVSASLDFLNGINASKSNINDIALIGPNELPVAPFDLLNFPGDIQPFNLTIISGNNNTFDVNIPIEVNGLQLELDKSQLIFNDAGVQFVCLYISINPNAQLGLRSFTLNITSGTEIYDEIPIAINVRYPENKIFLDSFHGLNDWDPLASVYQMSYYEWMKDIIELDIDVDYLAEYWTANYDKLRNNSILTEEKLAQYDLIVLQNPIVPYTPQEIDDLEAYFENGGNILFLGTRYQDMCVDNINTLFSTLDFDIEIAKENLIDEEWLGIGAAVSPQDITEFNSSVLFNGVTQFLWNYGAKLKISDQANALASKDGDTLVAEYDGSIHNKGKFLIFGDLHWASLFYDTYGYSQYHKALATNLMEYFFGEEDISLTVSVNTPRSSNSNVNISIYAKNKTSGILIDSSILNAYLNVSIKNLGFYDEIFTISTSNGLSTNYSYTLPFTSPNPYEISANVTINSQIYNDTIKVLYYDDTKIPKITSIIYSSVVERNGIETFDIDVSLNSISYNCSVYLSIYPHSYYSKLGTVDKMLNLGNPIPNPFNYSVVYVPLDTDPAGLAIFFPVLTNPSSNYTNPLVPRLISNFTNNPPEFNEDLSIITIDNSQVLTLSETYDDDSLNVYQASQGSIIDLNVKVLDSVSYEDQNSSQMTVSVNFLLAAITQSNSLVPLDASDYIYSTLSYDGLSDTQKGTLIIPFQMEFPSITGTKTISTASTYDTLGQDGYIGLILITVFDSEGESENFIVVLLIQEGFAFDLITIIIIIGIIIAVGVAIIILTHIRRKRKSEIPVNPYEYEQVTSDDYAATSIINQNVYYCPFCGERLTGLRNFCPSCGKSLNFD